MLLLPLTACILLADLVFAAVSPPPQPPPLCFVDNHAAFAIQFSRQRQPLLRQGCSGPNNLNLSSGPRQRARYSRCGTRRLAELSRHSKLSGSSASPSQLAAATTVTATPSDKEKEEAAAASARAGAQGYSVRRQPVARHWSDDTFDPVFDIPESLQDSHNTGGTAAAAGGGTRNDADWWTSVASRSKGSGDSKRSVPASNQDASPWSQSQEPPLARAATAAPSLVPNDAYTGGLNLRQRSLDTLDFPRLLQALSMQCTTVPAKRFIQAVVTLPPTPINNATKTNSLKDKQLHRLALAPVMADTVETCRDRYQAVQEMQAILYPHQESADYYNYDLDHVSFRNRHGLATSIAGRPPPCAVSGKCAFAWERIVDVAVTQQRVLDSIDIVDVMDMMETMLETTSWNAALVAHLGTDTTDEDQETEHATEPLYGAKFVQIPALVSCIAVNTTLLDLLHNAFEQSPGSSGGGGGSSGAESTTARLSGTTFPVIGQLRAQIRSLKADIIQTLEGLIATPAMQSKLSLESGGPVYSELSQSGRLVLPIDRQYSNAVGIVHDTSRSGKTVYVEPHEIIGPTNALKQAESALRVEEARVWRFLTEQIVLHRPVMDTSVAAVGQLDLIVARVALGRAWSGVVPMVGDEGVVQLYNAKHPILLLRARNDPTMNVVGSTIELGLGQNQGLILSGPNAGGTSRQI
jgi:hypothetical protein